MTRNNLGEHLSWLLTTKLSIPANDNALSPVLLSFTQAEPTPALSEIAELADTEVQEIDRATSQAAITRDSDEMARLRTEVGSGRPGMVTMGPRMHDEDHANASNAAPVRPLSTHANTSARAVPKPTPFSSARQVPYQSQRDVEVMDLTESLNHRQSPPAGNFVAGRKRKSAEMAQDKPAGAVTLPADAMPPRPRGSQQSFTAIDEVFEAPTDPPPPYSTLAPGRASPTRQARYVAAATSRSSIDFAPNLSPTMPDPEDDGDDLVDFSRNRSRTPACKKRAVEKQQSLYPDRIMESPPKPQGPARDGSFVLAEKDVAKALRTTFSPDRKINLQQNDRVDTIAPTASAATPGPAERNEGHEEVIRFLNLPPSEIESCHQRLHADYERRLDDITECIENDEDPGELQNLLDNAEERMNSMRELASKQNEYPALVEEREQLRAALKSAIRARAGVDSAKAATAACKDKTQTLLNQCAQHISICRDEVAMALQRRADGAEVHKKFAVQSTQAQPSHAVAKQPCVPSSSRIAQTQVPRNELHDAPMPNKQQMMQPPQHESPPDIAAYFSPSRCKPGSAAQAARESPREHFDNRDQGHDDEYGALENTDMLEANHNGFSNRMGTPPGRFEDEDEFDDEIMLDYAEELENYSAPPRSAYDGPSRPPLALTSGNSQMRPHHKSPKKKKRTPAKNDDANLEHLFRFPWSNDVKETLKARFRLRGFRENQVQAINATLAGKDVFVLMPTGGGKSLCYQLPSLVTSGKTQGVTIVISPLLSLMEDQVQHLRKLDIQAFNVNSDSTAETRNAVMHGLKEPDVQQYVQLLYVTPEMLSKSQAMMNAFERLYRRQRLARLVIDEAHCVSQWGHDFRPDYKLIGDVRKRFPSVPVMALTATATENVKLDTVHNLGITGCEILTSSFNRPNLYYEVRPKPKGKNKEDVKEIAGLIKEKYHRKSGIIYCLSRKNCETMAEALYTEYKIKAHHYHAGLESAKKREIQKKWQAGTYHVIVATIAFGMGIDKPDVRFVIHHTIPKSLEGYYQETGRAGRDQLPSGCYLFHGYQDISKLRRMIDDGEGDWEQKERQHQMLRRMAQYCDNQSDCRRVQVLRYFNENFDREECDGQCDNCCSGSNFRVVDFTDYAQQAVTLVGKIAPQKVTLLHCMDVFRGAAVKKAVEHGHKELAEFGAGKDLDRGDIERLFYHLLTERAIIEDNVVNKSGFANQYASLGKYSSDFRAGRKKLFMQMCSTPKPKEKAPPKKRAKKDPFEEQSKKWKKTAGSRAPAEMPMSTNISSPIQAATGRRKTKQRGAQSMHDNGYKRDTFVVSDPEHDDYADSDEDDFDDGFAPIREGNELQQRTDARRAPGPPITADDMMNDLDEVRRDAVEQFVRDGKEAARKIVIDRNLRLAPFSDTMLRHMAIMLTTTQEEMLKIPEVNPENVRLYGKRFCRLVQGFKDTYNEMMGPGPLVDPNARNVIDLVSDEEDEDSDDEYGDFPSEEDEEEGEASGYFPPHPGPTSAVAEFNARVDQSQVAYAHAEPGPTRQRKAAKGGKKRNWKATGSTAAPRRRNFSGGNRFASYSHDGPSAAGVGKSKASGRRTSGGGGGKAGGGQGGGRKVTNNISGANRTIVSMMPT